MALYTAEYNAVPFGKPIVTETTPGGVGVNPATAVTTGNWLHASVTGIHDYDNFATTGTNAITGVHYQWQYNDILTGTWISIFGANKADFLVTPFYKGALGMRVQVNYVDGKNYTEQLNSDATTGVSLGGPNTPPFLVAGTQFNGIPDTTALLNQPFDLFSPFDLIFADNQTAATGLTYTATLADGSPLVNAHLTFSYTAAPAPGTSVVGEFATLPGVDPLTGLPYVLDQTGQIGVRVPATDPGLLSVTNTFFITVVPPNSPPNAVNDSYTTFENVGLTAVPRQVCYTTTAIRISTHSPRRW